jgi:hypothetical protein
MITAAMLDAGIDACEDWNEDRMRSDVPMRFAYLCDAVYKAMTKAKAGKCRRRRAAAAGSSAPVRRTGVRCIF